MSELYVVRFYDGFDNQWIDASDKIPHAEALKIWTEKTAGGK